VRDGAWFQRDELRRAKDSADEDLRWLDFDVFADAESFAPTSGQRACPECSEPMNALAYQASGVVIDACPSDHGVWLDSGEFGRIVEHLETVVVTIDLGEYRKRAVEELREVVTGPEGRISELKDLLTAVRLLQYRLGTEHPGAAKAANAVTELSRRL
jgi:Zn-finger nucleic acid-binding protein